MTTATTTDLYSKLAVGPDATADEIKAAYRRLSLACHPDRPGGDRHRFEAVTLAYEILSDPDRRQWYDRTGQTDQAKRKTSRIESEIAKMLLEAFLKEDSVDPIRWMLRKLDHKRSEVSRQRSEVQVMRDKLTKRLDEFTRSNKATGNTAGRDFLIEALSARLAEFELGIAAANEDHKHFTDVMAFLNDLQMLPGKEERIRSMAGWMNMPDWSAGTAGVDWGSGSDFNGGKLWIPGMDDDEVKKDGQ